jgi:hypothetical protein
MSDLVTAYEIPAAGSAEASVLHNGYVGRGGDGERVSGTVTLISFADVVIPGHGAPFRSRKSG